MAILATIGDDIQEAAGALQVCAGQQAGCEAAVHAMQMIHDDPNNEAVALSNVNKKCPPPTRQSTHEHL